MLKPILALVGLCCSVGAPRALAADFELDLDASYSVANPDFSAFESGEGVSIYGQLVYADAWMLVARYNDAAFRPSGPVAGGVVETWSEAGLGYRVGWSERWSSEVIYTWQRVDNTRGSESGWQIQFGARLQALDTLSFALHLGYLDVLIDDWTLNLESKFQFHPSVYAIARLRDYADWDLTYYELGLGLSF
jgi:hypothetical protein